MSSIKHSFLAIDADSKTVNKLVYVLPNIEQNVLQVVSSAAFTDEREVNTAISSLRPRNITTIVGYENEAKAFETEKFAETQFETKKSSFLIENHNVDYFNVGSKCLLTCITGDSIQKLSHLFASLDPKTRININHTSVVLLYGFYRNYPDYFDEKTTGLLHVTDETAILVVIDQGRLVWHSVKHNINNQKEKRPYVAIVESARKALATQLGDEFAFDVVLVSGEAPDLLLQFKEQKYHLETWDLRRSGLFDFRQCSNETTMWVIALFGALMATENLGVDLSLNSTTIQRELKEPFTFNLQENNWDKVKETGIIIGKKVWPALVAESRVIAACVLVALGLFGYRYWATIDEATRLQEQLANETHRSTSLANVKKEYTEYKAQLQIINDRITQIYGIRESQLAVPTTLKLVLDSTPKLVNYGHLEVTGTNIKADGESYDKSTVVNFISTLGRSGDFEDVNPVYDSQSSKCDFTFSTHYRGLVQSLNPRNPMPQQIAKIN